MGNTIALTIGLIITLWHHKLLFPSALWREIEREKEKDTHIVPIPPL